MKKFNKNILLITLISFGLNSLSFADESIKDEQILNEKARVISEKIALEKISKSFEIKKPTINPIQIELKKVILESTKENDEAYDINKIVTLIEKDLNENGASKKIFENYGKVIKFESTYINTYSNARYENIEEETQPFISSSEGTIDNISAVSYNIMKFDDIDENTVMVKLNSKDSSISMEKLNVMLNTEIKLDLPSIQTKETEQQIVLNYGQYKLASIVTSMVSDKKTTFLYVMKANK